METMTVPVPSGSAVDLHCSPASQPALHASNDSRGCWSLMRRHHQWQELAPQHHHLQKCCRRLTQVHPHAHHSWFIVKLPIMWCGVGGGSGCKSGRDNCSCHVNVLWAVENGLHLCVFSCPVNVCQHLKHSCCPNRVSQQREGETFYDWWTLPSPCLYHHVIVWFTVKLKYKKEKASSLRPSWWCSPFGGPS